MTVHILVASVIQYFLSILLPLVMGNQSSCSIIDFSWNSMGLWIIILAAGAAAIYYYRHRIRRTTRKEIYKTNGGDMDVYKEFMEWKVRQQYEAQLPPLRAIEPPDRQRQLERYAQPAQPAVPPPFPAQRCPARLEDLESGLESLIPILRSLQQSQRLSLIHI